MKTTMLIKEITGYTLFQWFACFWLYFDEWRRFTPCKTKIKQVFKGFGYIAMAALVIADIWALSLIGFACM